MMAPVLTSTCTKRNLWKLLLILVSKRTVYANRLIRCQSNQWTSQSVRRTFIDYFVSECKHVFVPSASVVPHDDPSLTFVNAGMNQFKSIFQGTTEMDGHFNYKRVCNSQKCIRTGGKHNDLDHVGHDTYHHTFFEMLGNWSFGDYFKKEACAMAWNLLTNVYGIPRDRLYITYFAGDAKQQLEEDVECKHIWLELGVPKDRILPFGVADNFWEMGNVGPCGPCTEIHYNHTNENVINRINKDDPNVIELWNLVFMTHERQCEGSLKRLPRQHVDTGMGLERLAAILLGKSSNYDSDLFTPLFSAIQEGSKCPPYMGRFGNADTTGIDTAYRTLADHARMAVVAISDGVRPYHGGGAPGMLRKIMRRAFMISMLYFGGNRGFLASLFPVVEQSLGDAFPEITAQSDLIKDVINEEESKFSDVFDKGQKQFAKIASKLNARSSFELSGHHAFELNHDFGLSKEMIMYFARCHGLSVNMNEFENLLERSENVPSTRERLINQMRNMNIPSTIDDHKYDYTCDCGTYNFPTITSEIMAIVADDCLVDSVRTGSECALICDRTNFYSESGGQANDIGVIKSDSFSFSVDAVEIDGGYVFHKGTVLSGETCVHDKASLSINEAVRLNHMKNHTAAHLLLYGLKRVLGGRITQEGSQISEDKIRLDVVSENNLSVEHVEQTDLLVNRLISDGLPVYRNQVNLSAALQIPNLVTLPRQNYPTDVTVVSIGETPSEIDAESDCSAELCCGTHVSNTSHLGRVTIVRMRTEAKGVKRIIAVTGKHAKETLQNLHKLEADIDNCAAIMNTSNFVNCANTLQTINREINRLLLPACKIPFLLQKAGDLKRGLKSIERQYWNEILAFAIEEMAAVIESTVDPYVIHKLSCNMNKVVLNDLTNTWREKPLLAYGYNEIGKVVFGACAVPEHFVNSEVGARKWLESMAEGLAIRTQAWTSTDTGQTVDETMLYCFETRRIDEVERGMNAAVQFARKHFVG